MTLPELRIADWRPTKDTLHLYTQIVGKVRLATTPPRNHWWHAPLYVDVRGLTTGPLRRGDTTFDIALDLVGHELVVHTNDGDGRGFPLADGLSVADFDARLHAALAELGSTFDRGAAVRTDIGNHWYDGITPFPSLPSGDNLDGGGDPVTVFDEGGVAYYAQINFNRTDDTAASG